MITHQLTALTRTYYQQSSTCEVTPADAKIQAEALLNKIFGSYCNVFKNVVRLIDQKLYLALGFQRPQDCLRHKTPSLSHAYIDRLVRATETYLKLDPSLQYLDRVTEATFRTLQDVRDEDALVVWQEVLRQNENRRITPNLIKGVMDELGIVTEYPCKSKVQ